MKKMALHWQVIIALVLGVVYSVMAVKYASAFDWITFTADYIAPFGEIFVRVLKLIAVPMVLFSIIAGIGSLKNIKQLGRVGVKTLLIYVGTTMSAILIGLLLVNLIKPGTFPSDESRIEKRIEYELWLSETPAAPRLDEVSFLTDPQYADQVEQVRERMAMTPIDPETQEKSKGPLAKLVDIFPQNIFYSISNEEGSSNMLQVIFFAIFFGVVLVKLPKIHGKPVRKLVNGLNEVFISMINAVISVMPVFVFALMAGSLVKSAGDNMDKLLEQLSFLGHYSWVLVVALILVAFVYYPLLIHLFAKRITVKQFLIGIRQAQITAFSTSSSMATLPVTMECVNDKLKVSKPISSFVLPIGATVNMDGTSTYQAVAVVAMAQFHMIDLDFTQQMVIVLTATLASIGAAAVPSAGLVLMIVVLESVGLNPAWIAIILPVDRILDMCRTVVNVTGDATVASIIQSSENIEEEDLNQDTI
jgi:Na+/H+-dicarboxylate symporter